MRIILLCCFLLLCGCAKEAVKEDATWGKSDAQVVQDLQTKWTILAPQGQLWGFSNDQKITASIVEVKKNGNPDLISVYVDLSATANIPQQDVPKEQSTQQTSNKGEVAKTPVSVTLSGLARLNYEKISGKWHLLSVEGITLSVRPQ